MKILHIAHWYPNQWNPLEVPFIKEHFQALDASIEQELWHVQVRHEGSWFRLFSGSRGPRENFLVLDTRIRTWRLLELLTLALLIGLRMRLRGRRWDVVNVHIAYPILRFPRIFRRLFGSRVVITEHWSAYRSGFHLADGSKAKQRIQAMFHQGIPVVTVSRALMNDIVGFAKSTSFPQFVVPNVVDPLVFRPVAAEEHEGTIFLMVASWAPIKRPLVVMAAFARLLPEFPNAKLRIVGYGHQWPEMQTFVRDNALEGSVVLVGALPKAEIAREMQNADYFVHASGYETFSVVCAEALCSGLPVIASNVGGIPEFVDTSNGFLVDDGTEAWVEALRRVLATHHRWDRAAISMEATAKFSPQVVGEKLVSVYSRCIQEA